MLFQHNTYFITLRASLISLTALVRDCTNALNCHTCNVDLSIVDGAQEQRTQIHSLLMSALAGSTAVQVSLGFGNSRITYFCRRTHYLVTRLTKSTISVLQPFVHKAARVTKAKNVQHTVLLCEMLPKRKLVRYIWKKASSRILGN